jgi:enamine deaminase RidA (YjgF/YER057c/UK114 family)
MVSCAPGFNKTPAVIDGCSQLFLDVFGDAGAHTRSAVGMAELPFDVSVEIEAIMQVGD